MSWAEDSKDGVRLTLRIVPRASRDAFAELLGDARKVRIQAPPVEGKANRRLVTFLARALNVSASRVQILSGDTNRTKTVHVAGLTAEDVRRLTPGL